MFAISNTGVMVQSFHKVLLGRVASFIRYGGLDLRHPKIKTEQQNTSS